MTAPPHYPDPQSVGTTDRTLAYRQQARRLRRVYATKPSLLHARLKHLAQTIDNKNVRRKPTLSSDSPVAHHFAARVAARLAVHQGLLPYSARLTLLDEAKSLGIARFEANLIIAVTQHRHSPSPPPGIPSRRRHSWVAPVTAAAILQALLLTLGYLALS